MTKRALIKSPGKMEFVVASIMISGMIDSDVTSILLTNITGMDITVIVHVRDISRRKQEYRQVKA
jgi:hypothetical protein